MDQFVAKAKELGFTGAVLLRDLHLECKPELRAYCNAEQCPHYGETWVCPPGCGPLEECAKRVSGFDSGIVVQSASKLPPVGRQQKISRLKIAHNQKVIQLADLIRGDGGKVLPLTTGGCIVCQSCTYPDRPCIDPERRMHSLSAYGIDVGALCERAGLGFVFRSDMVYFVACLLVAGK